VSCRQGGPGTTALWKTHLHLVETELASGHVDVAVRAWHDAYGAALESRGWESMIAVGDAFMKIGHAAGTPNGARMNAREAYLTALIRARRTHSVDGALRSGRRSRGSVIAPSSNRASTSQRSLPPGTNRRSRGWARLGNAGRAGKPSQGLEEPHSRPRRVMTTRLLGFVA
jgi:hypothetical protein